jgi:serine/threonine-protein kinase HipA
MAAAAGIEMATCLLLAEGPRRHFMTRRFDRAPGGERHHVISLRALADLDYNMVTTHNYDNYDNYDQYLQTVSALGLGPDEVREAYRRIVFNVIAVNRGRPHQEPRLPAAQGRWLGTSTRIRRHPRLSPRQPVDEPSPHGRERPSWP